MSEIYSRKCYVCAEHGVSTPAGPNSKGVPNSARRRIGGVIRPVCPEHGSALRVARADVAGNGAATRQDAEREMVTAGLAVAAGLAERETVLTDAYTVAAGFLTLDIMRTFERASRRHGYGTLADAAEREMVETFLRRIAERVQRFEPVSDPARLAQGLTRVNVSERRHAVNVRGDVRTDDGNGPTFGENVADGPMLGETFAARVAGRTIGAEQMARLVRLYPDMARECGVTA